MKKVFSLILAVAMVLSLASVAFAAGQDADDYITSAEAKDVPYALGYVSELKVLSTRALNAVSGNLIFGKEYYLPIVANTATNSNSPYSKIQYATYAKQVGTLKATAEWAEGGEFIEDVGIKTVYVDKDADGNAINRNVYCIYVKTTGSSSSEENIVGKIIVTGTAGAGTGKSEKIETKISLDYTISNEVIVVDTVRVATSTDASAKYTYTKEAGALELFSNTKTMKNVKFDLVSKTNAVKFDNDVVATLDTAAAKKLTISYNTNELADVVASNPDAVLMFYNIECNFKESVEVTIEPIDPEADNYLYQVLNSGAVKDLTSTYSTEDEQFVLTQRKLTGSYIVSDMPLVF